MQGDAQQKTCIEASEQFVPEDQTKATHGAMDAKRDHQHQSSIRQPPARLSIEVIDRTSGTDMVYVFADNPQQKVAASTRGVLPIDGHGWAGATEVCVARAGQVLGRSSE